MATAQAAGERLAGVSIYDGHVGKAMDMSEREAMVHSTYDTVLKLLPDLCAGAPNLREIVTAGTQ